MTEVSRRLVVSGLAAGTLFAPAIVAAQTPMVLELPSYQLREGFGPWWRAAAEAFGERNSGIRVNLIEVPFEQHHQQLTTRFIAGNPPDLAHISARFFYGFADQGFLEPLDQRLAAVGWREQDFIPAQKDMRREGRTYAQLLLGYAYCLFYNERMLQEAGVSVPRNMDEIMAAAQRLTRDRDGDGRMDQFGMVWPTANTSGTYVYLTYLITGMNRDWIENGQLVDVAVLERSLAIVERLVRGQMTPPGLDTNPARQLFWQGNAAMYIDGSWAVAYRADSPEALRPALKVAPLPLLNQAAGASNVLALPARLSPQRKDAAFRFIAMIASPEWQQKYGEIGGNPPARLGMITAAARERWPELPLFEESAAKSTGSFMPRGREGEFNRWNAIVGETITAMVAGSLDAPRAAQQMHRQLQRDFF